MLESIFHAGSFDLINVALSMMVALILGLLIALCYKMTDKSSGYLPLMLAVMPLLVAVIILLEEKKAETILLTMAGEIWVMLA